jgi:hypothetical protein
MDNIYEQPQLSSPQAFAVFFFQKNFFTINAIAAKNKMPTSIF